MNPSLTEIAFILDRSGSMSGMAEPAIAGFNQFLKDQQQSPGDARLTLVLFDDEYLVPCSSLPISEVVELDTTSYIPRGSTALLDAIGQTIDDVGRRLTSIPGEQRPAQIIVAILTDGYENASQKYTMKQISKMIRHQEKHYSWQFLFLGANQDAIATAGGLGIARHNAATYVADSIGQLSSSKSFSRKVTALRNKSAGLEDLDGVADMSMSEILREEDCRDAD